jgi:hypothetical protein
MTNHVNSVTTTQKRAQDLVVGDVVAFESKGTKYWVPIEQIAHSHTGFQNTRYLTGPRRPDSEHARYSRTVRDTTMVQVRDAR